MLPFLVVDEGDDWFESNGLVKMEMESLLKLPGSSCDFSLRQWGALANCSAGRRQKLWPKHLAQPPTALES